MSFFAELKRRNVYKIAVAYAVVAWLLIQAASIILPTFAAPEWVMKVLIAALAVGFPLAVILAWAFEITPEGIVRAEDVLPNESITRRTGRKLTAVIVVVGLIASGLLVFQFVGGRDSRTSASTANASSTTATPQATPGQTVVPDKSIAVLPFQNLSKDEENAYFADGVQEEILTTLSKVADLKVISRTSVMQFRGAGTRNLREIAQQLGVVHVLEGSVQRAANRVRVTAQLIDARTDSHIWADRYDRDIADVFGIQTEIAQKIAGQLKARLSPTEKAAIQSKPTADTAAYDVYLRATEIERDVSLSVQESIEKRITLFKEAIARDPTFVAALCKLAQAHLQAYWFNFDHTPARLELAKTAIDAAARLQPDAGEVHVARGLFYYWGSRDYVPALAELELARRRLPNQSDVPYFSGLIERRQGHWEQAIRNLEEALVLDPRNNVTRSDLSEIYLALKRYDDARRVTGTMLKWKPDDFVFQGLQAAADLLEKADIRPLQKVLSGDAARTANRNVVADFAIDVAFKQRDYRAADQWLPDYSPTGSYVTPHEYYEGLVARGRGDTERAQKAFLRARERAIETVNSRPDDAKALIVLAAIDAALNRKEDAIREGEQAAEMLPAPRDAWDGPQILGRLAAIYAKVGETNRAIDLLDRLRELPVGTHYGSLKLDSEWDSLRGNPRFEKIVASLAPKDAPPAAK